MSILGKLIKQYSGQHNTVTFQRPYVEFTGSVDGALLLGQMIYWSDKGDEDGWFYKSYMDWQNEIYVKERSARSIAQGFEAQGFLEIQKRRTPSGTPKMHYRFLLDRFAIVFEDFLKAQNPDGDGLGNTAGTIQQNKKTGVDSADLPERSGRSAESETADLPNQPYIQLITNKLITNNQQDPECAIEIKACQVEIVQKEERTKAASPLALDQAGNAPTVNGLKNGEDKFSAPGRAALASPAAAEIAVKVDATTIVCEDMGHNGYGGFKTVYEGLCETVEGTYGFEAKVKNAWDVTWQGFEPPETFWNGLNLYCRQQVKKFQRDGKAYVFGAVRFLTDKTWESAIRINDTQQQALRCGVDITDPEAVKAAARYSSMMNASAIVEQRIAEKMRLKNA